MKDLNNKLFFNLLNKDTNSNARTGLIRTHRGDIETPIFMPVGTAGTVKAMTMEHLKDANAQIILGNTYHLFLRPGLNVINTFGSLHKFISWDKPILTDSGGFQIFSLKDRTKVTDDGVSFQSHIDGERFFLTPEKVVDIQNALGSDIQMVLDNFSPYPSNKEMDLKAFRLTNLWAKRAREHFLKSKNKNFQFAIVQGGLDESLRTESLAKLLEIDFDGYAVGGLSVGEPVSEFERIVSHIVPKMPVNKPRYLMGSGTPEEILFAVEHGIDMFDCVMPTRNARNGTLFTRKGKLAIKNEKHKFDETPLDENCTCYTCKNHSKAYLRHLYLSKEISSSILNSIHNIHFYLDFMGKIRYAIKLNRFNSFKEDFLSEYKQN